MTASAQPTGLEQGDGAADFGSWHYVRGLIKPYLQALTMLVLSLTGFSALLGASRRRVNFGAFAKTLLALACCVLGVAAWNELFLWVYDRGPISGCPDSGMHSTAFLFRFLHGGYITDYVGMPMLARVVFHAAVASGFVLAGYFAFRIHRSALVLGPLAAFPLAVRDGHRMDHVVIGVLDYQPLDLRQLLEFAWGFGLWTSVAVALGCVIAKATRSPRRRWA